MRLTLQQCIKLSLAHNLTLAIAKVQVQEVKAKIGEQASKENPSITFQNSYERTLTPFAQQQTFLPSLVSVFRRLFPQLGAISLGQSSIIDLVTQDVNLTWTVYDAGETSSLVAEARFNTKAAQNDYLSTQNITIYNVTRDYYTLLKAQWKAEVEQIKVKQILENERVTALKYKDGLVRLKDLLQAKSSVFDAKQALLESRNSVLSARAKLLNWIGIHIPDVQITGDLKVPVKSLNLQSLIQKAYQYSPDLAKIRDNIMSDKMAVRAAKAQMGPTTSLNGTWGYIGSEFFPNSRYWRWGIQVNLPLLSNGLPQAQKKEALMKLEKDELKEKKLLGDLALKVQLQYYKVEEAKQKIQDSKEALQEAEESLREIEDRYKQGMVSENSRLQAETAEDSAKESWIDSLYDYWIQLAKLRLKIGKVSRYD